MPHQLAHALITSSQSPLFVAVSAWLLALVAAGTILLALIRGGKWVVGRWKSRRRRLAGCHKAMYFSPGDIDAVGTPGRTTNRLYRRVKLNTRYLGIVRYPPELEDLVEDVQGYIAQWLDEAAVRRGYNVVVGRLYSPVDVPLPGESRELA